MNRVLKFIQSNNRKVFWTSDWHAFHKRDFVWESRGYKSAEDHTSFIRDKVNEIVKPNDVIINVGDITLNCQEGQFEAFINSINCQNMYLLWGNHNSPSWTIYKREVDSMFTNLAGGVDQGNVEYEVYPFRYKNITFVGNYLEMTVDGHYFVVSHYPIHVFNYMKDGTKMICGHSHGGLDFSQPNNLNSKILDVGWDLFKKPLSTEEVLNIMNKKQIFQTTDHHKNSHYSLDF